MTSRSEELFEKTLFASRWLLAPLFLGLSLALIALGFKFFQEAWHVFSGLADMEESDLVLTVLAMIDIVLVGSLIIMVMFSGYENFVSTIDAKGSDSLNWLGKLDAGTLKLKVAASIVAISSIHLLRIFMQVSGKDPQTGEDLYTNDEIMWYVILHLTFVVSAVLLGVLDRMAFAKHR
ncbi:MAG TPA: TIGR00645 family protein [Steroidobacteraceae bacterium]|nr:TIGR00645 family protein [Steroidobacteraceae bacterium]